MLSSPSFFRWATLAVDSSRSLKSPSTTAFFPLAPKGNAKTPPLTITRAWRCSSLSTSQHPRFLQTAETVPLTRIDSPSPCESRALDKGCTDAISKGAPRCPRAEDPPGLGSAQACCFACKQPSCALSAATAASGRFATLCEAGSPLLQLAATTRGSASKKGLHLKEAITRS